MAKRNKPYVLTETAAADFRAARRWSINRWGNQRTKEYFEKLHSGAEYIAAHQVAIQAREDLVGRTGLGVSAVGEHYIVYAPLDPSRIAIVSLLRQTRDVPAILEANSFQIKRQVATALQQLHDTREFRSKD